MCQRVQPSGGARKVCCRTREQPSSLRGWVALSIPATALTRFPQKELSLPSRTTHTSWRPPHLVRTPPTATPVAALPEQLAIITEPNGLAGACWTIREVAFIGLRARPRLAAVLYGCSSQPASVRERRVPDWIWGSVRTGTRRTPHARTSPATPATRRGGTGVVGMCLAESLRGLGGVYPDTAKVVSYARAVGT